MSLCISGYAAGAAAGRPAVQAVQQGAQLTARRALGMNNNNIKFILVSESYAVFAMGGATVSIFIKPHICLIWLDNFGLDTHRKSPQTTHTHYELYAPTYATIGHPALRPQPATSICPPRAGDLDLETPPYDRSMPTTPTLSGQPWPTP